MSGFRRGQWVYVHPGDGSAPRELRGLAGTVMSVRSGHATVAFRRNGSAYTVELETSILHHERRRRDRPPAQWPATAVARSA